jgi:hypothetical protein
MQDQETGNTICPQISSLRFSLTTRWTEVETPFDVRKHQPLLPANLAFWNLVITGLVFGFLFPNPRHVFLGTRDFAIPTKQSQAAPIEN